MKKRERNIVENEKEKRKQVYRINDYLLQVKL